MEDFLIYYEDYDGWFAWIKHSLRIWMLGLWNTRRGQVERHKYAVGVSCYALAATIDKLQTKSRELIDERSRAFSKREHLYNETLCAIRRHKQQRLERHKLSHPNRRFCFGEQDVMEWFTPEEMRTYNQLRKIDWDIRALDKRCKANQIAISTSMKTFSNQEAILKDCELLNELEDVTKLLDKASKSRSLDHVVDEIGRKVQKFVLSSTEANEVTGEARATADESFRDYMEMDTEDSLLSDMLAENAVPFTAAVKEEAYSDEEEEDERTMIYSSSAAVTELV